MAATAKGKQSETAAASMTTTMMKQGWWGHLSRCLENQWEVLGHSQIIPKDLACEKKGQAQDLQGYLSG